MRLATAVVVAGFVVAGAVLARPSCGGDPADPAVGNLQRRLDALELKVGDLADAALVPSEFTFTQDIAARELLVAAPNTQARISASVVGGVPTLVLTDSAGRARISLSASAGAPVVAIHDASGLPRAILAVNVDGVGIAQTYDSRGAIVGRLGLPTPQPGVGSPADDPRAAALLDKLHAAERARVAAEGLLVGARANKAAPAQVAKIADEARVAREKEAEARIALEQYVRAGAR